jgi:hypothetical protein
VHRLRTRPLAAPAVALASAVLFLTPAGCGGGGSTSDSSIAEALDLKRAANRYEIGGDPFCTIDRLLNDADEVEEASKGGGEGFVIASPNGAVGVLARRPFAPDCARQARSALKRLQRQSSD